MDENTTIQTEVLSEDQALEKEESKDSFPEEYAVELDGGEAVTLREVKKEGKTLQISKSAVIVGATVVLVLFIAAYVLTFVLDKGTYVRDAAGSIIPGTYTVDNTLPGIKWWQFILAPVLVLGSDGAGTLWGLIGLLAVLGAVFTALDESGILVYLIQSINHRFGKKKYAMLFILPFAFMFLGSTAGMFEELIPLVPMVILLSYAMGWDALVGLGMSLLAACFGFSSSVVNYFTVGVSQTLLGLPIYSGIELRILVFVLCYALLVGFLFFYAKRVEKKPTKSSVFKEDALRKSEFSFMDEPFVPDPGKAKALVWFFWWMCFIVVLAVVSIFWTPLAEAILYILVGIYVVAGIGACLFCGIKGKALAKLMVKGLFTLLPAVAMILIAGGIRYVIETGQIMDTILYLFTRLLDGASSFEVVLLLYLIIMVFEIFIPSATGKAYLLMPMIAGICATSNINLQVAVLAFAFADGFANAFFPTNAGLLLVLGFTTVNYGKWAKWAFKYMVGVLAICIGVLALAHFVTYA